MENFDIKKARLVSITIGICLIFVLVVANAYKYLPEEDIAQTPKKEIIKESFDNKKVIKSINNDDIDIEENSLNDNSNLENDIEEPLEIDLENNIEQQVSSSNDKQIDDILKNAMRLLYEKNYSSSIFEFEKALEIADNNTDKAFCYDKIALNYAFQNRYNKSLEMAKKAYSTLPNSQREFFIARLYNKMGNFEESEKIIKNIMNREFLEYDK